MGGTTRRTSAVVRTLRRYGFTIAGIAIGVAGIVALGAMGGRVVRFIEGGDRFVLGQISVAGKGMGIGAGFTAGGGVAPPAPPAGPPVARGSGGGGPGGWPLVPP